MTATRFECDKCKDTGATFVAFYSARDTRCDCPAGDWLRIPEAVRVEIVAYVTALEMAQRKANRQARRAARQA